MPPDHPPLPWTPADEARARDLVARARAHYGDSIDFLKFNPQELIEDGWDPTVAGCIAAAPDLLERALAEIERLRAAEEESAGDRDFFDKERIDLALGHQAALEILEEAGHSRDGATMHLNCPACQAMVALTPHVVLVKEDR